LTVLGHGFISLSASSGVNLSLSTHRTSMLTEGGTTDLIFYIHETHEKIQKRYQIRGVLRDI
jgi:hypothetical protein